MGKRTLINVQTFVLKAKRCFYLFLATNIFNETIPQSHRQLLL